MKTILTVLVTTALYATLRYNVFKGVAWSEWPVYVLNKVFALSALLLLMIYALRRRRSAAEPAGRLLPAAWTLMLLHAGISLVILNPAYYAKYFQIEKLTWQAGWSMMLGVVAAVGLHKFCRACELSNAVSFLAKVGILAFLSGLHAALLGYAGWFQPATWPGHMIPITLISFVAGSVALGAAFLPQPKPHHS
jgi:branched-subunit amino acid transport protein AzlD